MKYLAKWHDFGSEDFQTVGEKFFCDDNGYSEEDIKRASLLKVGETLDLSDITQTHTIERVL